jgi:hypothetical protein
VDRDSVNLSAQGSALLSLSWSAATLAVGIATGQPVLAVALQLMAALWFFRRLPPWRVFLLVSCMHAAIGTLAFMAIVSCRTVFSFPAISRNALLTSVALFLTLGGLTGALSLARGFANARRAGPNGSVPCIRCGYRIDNLPSPQCPECGSNVDISLVAWNSPRLNPPKALCASATMLVAGLILALRIPGVSLLAVHPYLLEHLLLESSADRGFRTLNLLDLFETMAAGGSRVGKDDVLQIVGNPESARQVGERSVFFYSIALERHPKRRHCVMVVFLRDQLSAVYRTEECDNLKPSNEAGG